MNFTKPFNSLSKEDTDIAGGKGASLGEMINVGIPVPTGFVILSDAFEQFLRESKLLEEIDTVLHSVNHNQIHTVEAASEKIRSLILSRDVPVEIVAEVKKSFEMLDSEYVAVRSSATVEDGVDHAWAGQLESFLNTTESDLLDKIKRCWASLFTPRAIFYRFEKGLHVTKISVAVVVQKMIESEVSGIAFSVHPVTEDENQIIIEASYGLGEAIVSGAVTPDSYVVEKNPRRIIDITIVPKQKAFVRSLTGGNRWTEILPIKASLPALDDKQIIELSDLIIKIEKYYGFPCDIEWAYADGIFYITQSRPITTLSLSKFKSEDKLDPSKFQRLFQVGGMPFLVSDAFMDEYRNIHGIAMLAHGTWTTFLPKESIVETLKEGLALYSNKKSFDTYKNEFESYKKETNDLFNKISGKSSLEKGELEIFLNNLTMLFKYYRRTEFFATDDAYQYSLTDSVTRENLAQFEYIKNSGREYLNKLFFGSESHLAKILQILSTQFDLSEEILRLYSKTELLDLFDSVRVSDSDISQRRLAYVMIGSAETLRYVIGKEAEAIVSKFDTTLQEYHSEFKGKIANKGKVKGRAKVITADYGNFDGLKGIMEQMQKGDILIAETTSPELMPACSKASAIVTNQGGMMSHAAIISREMNIPCIVGTENATDIIKDGDIVEVDADNGVVKILK